MTEAKKKEEIIFELVRKSQNCFEMVKKCT